MASPSFSSSKTLPNLHKDLLKLRLLDLILRISDVICVRSFWGRETSNVSLRRSHGAGQGPPPRNCSPRYTKKYTQVTIFHSLITDQPGSETEKTNLLFGVILQKEKNSSGSQRVRCSYSEMEWGKQSFQHSDKKSFQIPM